VRLRGILVRGVETQEGECHGGGGRTFTLLIGNAGPGDDSVSYQVILTPTASAGGSGATIRALPGSYLARLPHP